jgi:hypothetical protein
VELLKEGYNMVELNRLLTSKNYISANTYIPERPRQRGDDRWAGHA